MCSNRALLQISAMLLRSGLILQSDRWCIPVKVECSFLSGHDLKLMSVKAGHLFI